MSPNCEGDPPQHRVLEVVRREKGAAEDDCALANPGAWSEMSKRTWFVIKSVTLRSRREGTKKRGEA